MSAQQITSSLALFILVFFPFSHGLMCWTCNDAKSNWECARKGRLQKCRYGEGCENEIRYHGHRIQITKRCKQLQACSNGQFQNIQKISRNYKYQCGAYGTNSVCTCCCDKDYCNKEQLTCLVGGQPTCRPLYLPNGSTRCFGTMNRRSLGTRCLLNCRTGYATDGPRMVTCRRKGRLAEWSHPVKSCKKKPTCVKLYSHSISNGNVRCTGVFGMATVGTSCVFRCNSLYFMVNENKRKASNYERTVCTLSKSSNVALWSRKPPNCLEEMCPLITRQMHGTVTCSSQNKIGSTCVFACLPGYQLIGKVQIMCQQQRVAKNWNHPQPVCQPKPCPLLRIESKLLNMDCTDHHKFGSICSFKCNKGYYMTKPNGLTPVEFYTTTCTLNKDILIWSHDNPKCYKKTCSQLSNPTNGFVKCTNSNKYLSQCKFACTSPVHELSGEENVICEDDGNFGKTTGVWSSEIPKCTLKKCPTIEAETTSIKCNKGFQYGSSCTFNCNTEYFMVANDGMTITRSRAARRAKCILKKDIVQWNKQPPRCEKKRCLKAEDPSHGFMICTNANNFGSTCSFTCHTGFEVHGEPEIVCKEVKKTFILGKWSQPTPDCARRRCPQLFTDEVTSNMTCSNGNLYESACVISCHLGHYMKSLNGRDVMNQAGTTCHVTGDGSMAWQSRLPICQPKTCQTIRPIPNIVMSCSEELIYNAKCNFTCLPGYDLVGESSLVCDDDGKISPSGRWSSRPPSCIPKQCEKPNANSEGTIVQCTKGLNFNSRCNIICKKKYFMKSPETNNMIHAMKISCDLAEDGEVAWSPTPSTCIPVSCEEIPTESAPELTSTCSNGNLTKSKCAFSCSTGYELIGNETNTCKELGEYNAEWKHPLPTCQIRSCLVLVNEDESANMSCTDGSNYQSKCNFRCLEGLGLFMTRSDARTIIKTGVSTSQCTVDSKRLMSWTGELPKCHVKFCPVARAPKYGRVKCTDGSRFHSKCFISCRRGYRLSGRSAIICDEGKYNSPHGKWSHAMPTCAKR